MDERNVQGLSYERLYAVYNGMISRCHNKNNPHYDLWGGRGIKVVTNGDMIIRHLENGHCMQDMTKQKKENIRRSKELIMTEIIALKIVGGLVIKSRH